jgi:release factor glutamine methyltransferase
MILLRVAVARMAARLAAAGIEDPRREARLILAAALGVDAAGLLLVETLADDTGEDLLRRRLAREPLAYILGRREFWGLEFATSPATLIPRPDSETLIEAALQTFPERAAVRRILDLGTGTGCLLLAALHEFPAAFGVGVDLSAAAAALAGRNAENLHLAGRASFLAGNWDGAIEGQFDLILSNPPYIQQADMVGLMPEVAVYEPVLALNGGPDGLAAYRMIISALPRLLAPRGAAVLELGAGQADDVAALAAAQGLGWRTRADLGGHQRALILQREK